MRRLLPIALLAGLAAAALVAGAEKFGTLPEPPAPVENYRSPAAQPQPVADDAAIPEPEVTITPKGEDQHAEYRIGGRLYMIKVTPKRGRPYYLIDRQGRGDFERSDLAPSVTPPAWVLKEF